MDRDDQMRRTFGNLRFAGEPPMGSTSADDLRRAERHRRRRRALAGGSGFAAVAAMATAAAFALPTQSGGGSTVDGDRLGTVVAGSGQESNYDDDVPFPKTRQRLLDTAVEHFDPSRDHLPAASTGALSVTYAATALSWTNPGESGIGLVSGYVTRAGYASSEPNALEDFAARLGCDIGSESCTQQTIPGTDRKAWVADADPDHHFLLGVVYERADGSLVGVATYDWVTPSAGVILIGDDSDSTGPVSSVDITREDAFAFVTDTDLRVDPDEAG